LQKSREINGRRPWVNQFSKLAFMATGMTLRHIRYAMQPASIMIRTQSFAKTEFYRCAASSLDYIDFTETLNRYLVAGT
jgi:hypothetical protein